MSEHWKPVVGFKGLYVVSDRGRVKRCPVERVDQRKGRGGPMARGNLIRPHDNGRGYLALGLSKRGRSSTQLVHRLVARAFLGPCPKGKQVNHRDGNKRNNRVSNLEYLTCAENHAHGRELGLMRKACGTDHGNARLTPAKVRRIRALRERGLTLRQIGERFGMTETHVSRIVLRRLWAHVE